MMLRNRQGAVTERKPSDRHKEPSPLLGVPEVCNFFPRWPCVRHGA